MPRWCLVLLALAALAASSALAEEKKDSTKVQVIYNGQTSNAVTMPVLASHPGIFSLDATGLGPGAILNQDYSINSGPNGAPRGSAVSIYSTGGGVTNPAIDDGAVTGKPARRLGI